VIRHVHNRTIQGQEFLTGSVFHEIPNSGSASILLNIGSINTHVMTDIRTDGDANMLLFENAAVTDSGTQNIVINKYRGCGSTINSTVWANPTVTTSGTIIHTAMFHGGSGADTKFTSAPLGIGVHGEDIILNAGSLYWIKLENISGRELNADWNFEFHEHI